jgi:hypothetical protein
MSQHIFKSQLLDTSQRLAMKKIMVSKSLDEIEEIGINDFFKRKGVDNFERNLLELRKKTSKASKVRKNREDIIISFEIKI